MKSKFCLILTILLLGFTSIAKAQTPADSAQIFLLTASPGTETYAAFGHSAIRVYDPTRNYDVVYNFGTFDFSTPNFYLKFGWGRLMYFLSKAHYQHFLEAYQSEGQAIYQQKFNLTNEEKWQFINNLEMNYLPENRYYRYDFFYDNCATRIRDLVEKSVTGKLIYDSTYIAKPETFRQLIEHDLGRTPWNFFGINILMGKGTDSIANLRNYMFLPIHMRNIFEDARVSRGDSTVALTEAPVELFPTRLTFQKPSLFETPEVIMCLFLLLVIGLTYWGYKKNLRFRVFDFLLFFITGVLGLLVAALATSSLHTVLHHNSNLFWTNPANLIVAVGLLVRCQKKWFSYALGLYLLVLLIFIPVSFFIMQDIPLAGQFLALVLAVRMVAYFLNNMAPIKNPDSEKNKSK